MLFIGLKKWAFTPIGRGNSTRNKVSNLLPGFIKYWKHNLLVSLDTLDRDSVTEVFSIDAERHVRPMMPIAEKHDI